MAVIRVTPPIEETPIPQPDIEIVDGILKIGYIENQSDAFIQTDFSCGDDDKVKIEKEILYFDKTDTMVIMAFTLELASEGTPTVC